MQHLGTLINCLFFRLKLVTMIFARISFDKCYMSLVETEDFNVLTDNKPVKNKHEAYRKVFEMPNNDDFTTGKLLHYL